MTAILILSGALISGCSSFDYKHMVASDLSLTKSSITAVPPKTNLSRRQIAVFFDGTANNEKSDTNVKRLHSLVTLQDRNDLSTLYVEGVGTSSDVTGMATGAGIGPRVRLAYEFLLQNYQEGDQVYIFGFSRGAYSARILSSLLYHAGLPRYEPGDQQRDAPDARLQGSLSSKEIAEAAYDAVKEKYSPGKESFRRAETGAALATRKIKQGHPIAVEVLGLWDTVEALGYPDWGSKILHKLRFRQHVADVGNANPRYGDTLCNVRNAFHAVAIDDNREWIFTPLLITQRHLFSNCLPMKDVILRDGSIQTGRLQEVWFAGAHSDVGGGYADSLLSGVSLNWMIKRIESTGNLLPQNASVRQDSHGTSHDPEGGGFAPVYHAVNRNLVGYAQDPRTLADYSHKLCIHPEVFARRSIALPKAHENYQLVLMKPGVACLKSYAGSDFALQGRLFEDRQRKNGPCDPVAQQITVQSYPHCQGVQ